jgi:methionine sulfoxide reductase heme-binding subunit
MNGPDPAEFGWWLASRAAGIVALLCIAISVGIGLAMAGRVSRRPELARTLLALHQQTALIGLVAIAVRGITLLGDRFMSPSIGDIALPFTSAYEPLWTGLGVTGGWLAAILGLSYWIRQRIGPRLWRKLHRATILVYVLSVAHTLGAGTERRSRGCSRCSSPPAHRCSFSSSCASSRRRPDRRSCATASPPSPRTARASAPSSWCPRGASACRRTSPASSSRCAPTSPMPAVSRAATRCRAPPTTAGFRSASSASGAAW